MARAYSMDLRERAVAAAEAGALTREEVAEQFDISAATLYNWLRLQRETGTCAPLPRGGGRQPSLDGGGMQQLRAIVEEENDRTLAEYVERIREKTGVEMSISAMDRALKKLHLPRKKRR